MMPSNSWSSPFTPDQNSVFFPFPADYNSQRRPPEQRKLPKRLGNHKVRGLSDSPERKGMSLNVDAVSFQPSQNENQSPQSVANHQFEGNSTDVTHSSIHTESLNMQGGFSCICEHLDLTMFKLKQCTKSNQHNHKHCPYFHNSKDRKRMGSFYSSDMCEHMERDKSCPLGDTCTRSHNRVEQLYRPEKYKTKFCSFYPNNITSCEYGQFCSFAHNESEISIELIHNLEFDDDFYIFYFKTVWCPFNLAHHDRSHCVYAHNWQDYRRKPQLNSYENTLCPWWKSNEFIGSYDQGCRDGMSCQKCHGWKENEYHPFNYKTKQCQAGKNCQKGRNCPQYHTLQERRIVSQNIQNKIFRLIPKNRIVTNTFKFRSEKEGVSQSNNSLASSRRSTVQSIPSPLMQFQDLFSASEINCSAVDSKLALQVKQSSSGDQSPPHQQLQQIPSPERNNRRSSLNFNINEILSPAFKAPADRKFSLQGVHPLSSILEETKLKKNDEISNVGSEEDEYEESSSDPELGSQNSKGEKYKIKYKNSASSKESFGITVNKTEFRALNLLFPAEEINDDINKDIFNQQN